MKKKKMWRKKINSLFETLNLLNILYQLKQKQIPKIKNKWKSNKWHKTPQSF